MLIPRYLTEPIHHDLEDKMVFISGPRQVGKTTLAKTFLECEEHQYYNWDNRGGIRKRILAAQWPAVESVIVFDELHNIKLGRAGSKGEYDSHGDRIRFIITGSADWIFTAREEIHYRDVTMPIVCTVFRLVNCKNEGNSHPRKKLEFPEKIEQDLLPALFQFGSFPEPFLKHNKRSLRRWQRERLDRFFREDVRDLENVRDLSSMELLASMLEDRIGSLLSLQSLREDLEVSHRAVSHWMTILGRLYHCFSVTPFTHKSIRSLKKAAKVYLWDWSVVPDDGPRFENLVACHLLKMKHVLEDQEGYRIGLHYLRDAGKREVDFLVTVENEPWFAVECKTASRTPNPALNYYGERLKIPYLYQITLEEGADTFNGRVRIMPAGKFLGALP